MREILFRGKRVDNGEWVYGYLLKWPIRGWKSLSTIIVPIDSLESGMAEQVEVDPETVGQYTGLADKNGKRIYENDIVNCKTNSYLFERYTIEWYNDDARFVMVKNGRRYAVSESFEYEIVGNITDNPDMA